MTRLARRRCALAISVSLALAAGAAQAQSIVISQVYGGGGNSGATLKSDFIELHNNGSAPVDLTGWHVAYASATGTSWSNKTSLSGTIQPGGYYLIKEADGTGGDNAGTALAAPDTTGTIAMGGGAGKVALVKNSTTLDAVACPSNASIVDIAGYGAASTCAGTTTALTNNQSARRLDNGCTDTGANAYTGNGADFERISPPSPRNSGSTPITCSGGVPAISIDDVTQAEGNSGTSTFTFTVSLSAPAPAGGVTFDIATSDGTATTADNDYVASSLTSQTIPAGSTSYTFTVTVNGDTVAEVNQSFNVTLSNIVGATVGDASGLGTIQNDDGVIITPINQIQGSGTASPFAGQELTTEGVVTLVRSNSFYIQSLAAPSGSLPARDDGNPATSDGILVFNPLPSGMGVGDVVQVTGPVIEYLPVPNTFPVTQFGAASNIVDVGDAPLPAAKELTAADFSAALLTPDVLENLEGMYVHIASGRIISPTRFTGSSTANEFEIVVDGVQRPMREAGVSIFDNYAFPRAFSPVYFDANQERIKLYPATGFPQQVDARGTVSNVYGTLTYYGASTAENSWQIYYDPAQIGITSGLPAPVMAQGADDVTIAGYNLEWFGSGSVSEYGTLSDRIAKAGAVICDWLKTPDILGTVEVDGNPGGAIEALQPLADYINANCASAPNYVAYMLGTGDQSLGFLVKTASVGSAPRVQLQDVDPAAGIQYVQQHGAGTLQMLADPTDAAKLRPYPFTDHVANPTHESTKLLNDRPPLRLKAVVNFADGRQYPITVIVVHQKALGDNTNVASSPLGYKDYGAQSRAKRAEQAYELAQLVKDAQVGNLTGTSAGEKVVLVGDFNSFGFNDGYVDAMGITTGHPAPDAEVLLPYTSPLTPANGLVVDEDDTYNFIADPEERYSYNFDSINQALDHVLFNQSLLADTSIDDISVDHARVNSDFRTNQQKVFNAPYNMTTNLPVRTSDHDPVRLSIKLSAPSADLSASLSGPSTALHTGTVQNFTFSISNSGPNPASQPSVVLRGNAPASNVRVTPPSGWTCNTFAIGSDFELNCASSQTLAAGASANFTSTIRIPVRGRANPDLTLSLSAGASTGDPASGNNNASYQGTIVSGR
ncbi:lamin tail domain-containing protein [Thermomonas sp. HDW16]|uniref:lamin tail domain-containing protein n=1 Tax=Thermomonas sp. HDW16 TaxID=2714945 RepID=UPI00140D369A|nr:lamin tail domain-containing protein [Thermomonas sp. HDW16]QIL21567.1 hypothetical protein G7079_12935 [Thermomonas sp. HDW16]